LWKTGTEIKGMPGKFFVTGTDTNIGKTVLCSLLCAALDAFYWKPIQTGSCEGTDRDTVARLAQLAKHQSFPESYCFEPPVSPHLAAAWAGTRISLGNIGMPEHGNAGSLIVEGAGGVMVPINDDQLMTDLMRHLGLPVLLASRSTLGTINHTLLSLSWLRQSGLTVTGVVMIGPENDDNRCAIEKYGNVPVVGAIPHLETLSRNALLEVYRTQFDPQAFTS
jgi:dethiobiotin synthetase